MAFEQEAYLVHQYFRRRCSSGQAQAVDAIQPGEVDFAGALDQFRSCAAALGNLYQAQAAAIFLTAS